MESNEGQLLKKIKVSRVIWPILIGFAVVGVMMYTDDSFNLKSLGELTFTWKSAFWLLVAVLLMVGRDIGYMIRIRILAEGALTWRQAFRIIMLWEFTSAITPSAVGGTSLAVVYVHKEGISVGKSSTMVMITSLLDEIYFIVMFPLVLFLVGTTEIFDIESGIRNTLITFAIVGYSIKLIWVILLSYGLFRNPKGLSKIIQAVFKLPILRRWKAGAAKAGEEIVATSAELKHKTAGFWIKSLASTFLSWTSRYWVVNAILLAFFVVDDHFLLFARQLVMFIMLLVAVTPGASGFAEWIFPNYVLGSIALGGLSTVVTLLWRLVTYYPYLLIGIIIVPRWLRKKFGKTKSADEQPAITSG